MDEKPLVSIIVILKDFFHLANLTLDSIVKQTENSYEIIVIETALSRRELIMIKPYQDKIKIIEHSDEKNLTALMNKGLLFAEGKYVHFLSSGDTYVSKYVISYLKNLIESKNFPDLICCAFLRRDELTAPESISFSFEYFKRGKIPMHIQSSWFSKSILDKFNGLDMKYSLQSGFDLICKIFLLKDKKVIFSNRVLTDWQFKKRSEKIFLKRSLENITIMYKNFGFVKTVFWWMIHDHFRMFKVFMLSVKKSFWNP
ncbi:MAG: glycosyltransferase [Parachlamydiales bacterium]|nr:glycosyltransferase [Parachlamydiales bacterium]